KATLTLSGQHDYVELLAPYDPTNTGKDSISAGERFSWNTVELNYVSEPQHLFTYSGSFRYGGYYAQGHLLTAAGDVGYRFQPFGNISMNASYNQLRLPQPWGRQNFLLIGPRIDVTFTNTL